MYRTITRNELATMLHDDKTIYYVNPWDKHFYSNTYLIYLDTGCYVSAGFLVHYDNEQNAYDEIADYCDKKGYKGYFADESYIEELRNDAIKDGYDDEYYINDFYSSAGNEGKYFANMLAIFQLK